MHCGTQKIEEMLQNAASALTNRRVPDLLALFSFPCPVFAGDKVKVVVERDYVVAAMNRYFEELDRCDVSTVRLGDHSIKKADSAKYVVDAQWLYLKSDGGLAFASVNHLYVKCDHENAQKIEMIEIVHSTSPAFHSAMGTRVPMPQA